MFYNGGSVPGRFYLPGPTNVQLCWSSRDRIWFLGGQLLAGEEQSGEKNKQVEVLTDVLLQLCSLVICGQTKMGDII